MFALRKPAGSLRTVLLIRGRDAGGRETWHFLQTDSVRLPLLQHSLRQEKRDLSQFGQVLAAGYGAQVPEHVQARMRAVYGYKG